MRENGGYMRVYWSGAWYFFAADIRLRERSNGLKSLDNALEQLNQCCATKSMSVAEIIDQLDKSNDERIFENLYQQVYRSRQMPSFEPLLAQLGISINDDRVQLAPTGAAAQRRAEFLTSTAL